MTCRIGITTRPDQRKKEWEIKYPNLSRWEILNRYYSKSAAQKAEKSLAIKHGCTAHGGGSGNEKATWYVYIFYY